MIYIYNNMREHVYSESGIKAGKVIWYNLVTGAFPLQIAQHTNDVTVTNLQCLFHFCHENDKTKTNMTF